MLMAETPRDVFEILLAYAERSQSISLCQDPEKKHALHMEMKDLENAFRHIQNVITDGNSRDNAFSQSWSTWEENVDEQLLQKQMVSLALLSKDIDLPESLTTDLAESFDENIHQLLEGDNDNEIDNHNQNSKSNVELPDQLILPIDNYNLKAEMFGLTPNKPQIDTTIHALGTQQQEDLIDYKVNERIKQLKKLPANLGTYDSSNLDNDLKFANDDVLENIESLKIDALVELLGLKALPLQRQLKNNLMNKLASSMIFNDELLNNNSVFKTWKRTFSVHPKQKVVQTARLAEKLLEQKKKEQEKKLQEKQKKKIELFIEKASEFQNNFSDRQNKRYQLGKQINNFHQQVEKDESKKLERTAKERLQALKANDEEAYIKLLDQTKDKRITHLLKQTNSFLDSLANAVKVQQQESKIVTQIENGESLDENNENSEERRDKIDYYEVAHKVKEPVNAQPSILIGGTLKEYQIKGLEWMVSLYNNHLNGILADEMGLGKTIQSISLITYLIEKKKERGKFLVIVPLSTITNWTLEFERWAPSVRTIVYKGSQQERRDLQYHIRMGDFTVLLTTFEYIIRDRPMLAKFKWAHMLIDEGHRLKNTNSKLFQTLITYYHTRNRLILTGTPLQNNLPELWALLNFILPKVFNSVKSFDEWFNTPFANTGHQEKLELSEEESLLVIRRLHKVLRPFLLRRLKKDVEKDLPDKIENVIKCKKSALQKRIYKQLLDHNALFIGSGAIGATKSGLKGLNNKIMQLRKACNHPFVFEEVENAVNPAKDTTDMIWRSSGKFELLDRVLPKFHATGHRTLMFFQMTQVMDIMEDYLRLRGLKYLRLDGSTKADDRQSMLKEFNAPNSEYFCFLLSTRAGGLGLNLQTADTVIIFDTDWNPHQDLQAQDRAHRIGQKNAVQILRLITDDSVEEMILERAHQKLDIDGKVIQAGKFDNKSSAAEQEELLRKLIEAEKEKDKLDSADQFDDEELNTMLARSEEEKIIFAKIDEDRKNNEDSKLNGKSRLMTDDEVPEIFKEDMSEHLVQESSENNGRRIKKKVYYDDGLTEEQWLDAMDAENDTVEEAAARKRFRDNGTVDPTDYETPEIENENEANEQPAVKKVKKEIPEWVNHAKIVLDEIENCEDDNGNNIGNIFLKLPSRRFYPDYYKLINHTVSINKLRKSLSDSKISTWLAFEEECRQMFLNARTYNQEGSVIVNCANIVEDKMEKIIKQWYELKTERWIPTKVEGEENGDSQLDEKAE
ncbi:RSC chromatin remodeling complex ATPase subunit [Martiniozyma asiatica (nom. inval.)]|nr:RSC chromatin remodeling complex ATPase subunit [Martiniozyma asiatica]